MPKYDVTVIITVEADNEDEAFEKGVNITANPDDVLEVFVDGVLEVEEDDE